MSTILKALRRLEEEKAVTEESRPLREQIASAPRTPLRGNRTGWVAAAVALVLGVATGGGAIWWLFGRTSAPIEIAAASPMAAPSQAAPQPVLAPPVRAGEPGPPTQAFESDVEMVDRPDALPRLADSDPVEPGPVQPKPGSVRPVENSAAAERARHAALAEYSAAERARSGAPSEVIPPVPPQPPDPIPAEAEGPTPGVAQAAPPAPVVPAPIAPAPVVMPESKVAVAAPAPKPAPPKPAARPAPRKPAPTSEPTSAAPTIAVSVEKTQWHPLADRRIAWLSVPGESEPHKVIEGDVVEGLIVSAIEPSGVVFERDGQKIRRELGQH